MAKAFEASPAGRIYRSHRWYEDIPPASGLTDRSASTTWTGTYEVQVRLFHDENGFGEDILDCSTEVIVPPMPNAPSAPTSRSTSAPSGKAHPANARRRTRAGIQRHHARGKPLKLSDYKGKYVVLKWWWNWSEMDVEARR